VGHSIGLRYRVDQLRALQGNCAGERHTREASRVKKVSSSHFCPECQPRQAVRHPNRASTGSRFTVLSGQPQRRYRAVFVGA
jgi:hypothetical protein